MKIENLFLRRMRDLPEDAQTPGHRLALKGGWIHQTAAGVYVYSGIALKAIRNIEEVVRQELDAVGCQEILMPVLSPVSLWEETGRADIDVLLRFKTRAGAEMAMNPTHEEVVVDYARTNIQSYRQLPFTLYQFQTKYRDELRVKAGLLRCREFLMKDAYSFHADDASLDAVYDGIMGAYERIYRRLGLDGVVMVEAPGGDIAGQNSHEFQWPSPVGEDTIYICDACGFKSNKEILTDGDKDARDVECCPECGGSLRSVRAVEVGNIFRLGDKYARPMKVSFTAEDGTQKTPVMGCYGIGISRTLGCLLENSSDEGRAVFNMAVAPYKVHVIALGTDEKVIYAANRLHDSLAAAGIEVIIDATDARAGSKFADADLLGAPVRAVLSDKNLSSGLIEMKYSGIGDAYPATIPLDNAAQKIIDIIKGD